MVVSTGQNRVTVRVTVKKLPVLVELDPDMIEPAAPALPKAGRQERT